MGNLTPAGIKALLRKPGRYGDGKGLYLEVAPSKQPIENAPGSASWIVRVQKNGRRRDIGLGSFDKVPLARARQLATDVRSQVEAGIDPVAERRKAAGIPTFRQAAAIVHSENKATWRNGKHGAQWLSSLEAYAFPHIGDLSVANVTSGQVRDLLVSIWLTKNETARRVRQRIATVIDWAVAKGYREASLPMTVINKALPKAGKGGHHAAMPWADLPGFMVRLREKETWGRLAVEATILTAARSGEIREAAWSEVDLEKAVWTIPARRMKAGREHVVPLSPAAVALFERAHELRSGGQKHIFAGANPEKPMSDMTLTKVLRDMGEAFTVHGFRSTFRDWVAEATSFSSDLAEAALAHVVGDKTVAAYQRGTMLEKRRVLMSAWGSYAGGEKKVVTLASPFNSSLARTAEA
jgi:integrase